MSDRGRFFAITLLGAARAREGVLGKLAIGLGVMIAAWAVGKGAIAGHHARDLDLLARLPVVGAGATAWGAGVLVAFAASSRALVRDEQQGIASLVASKGSSQAAYVVGRALGLALVLFALTAFSGLATSLAIAVSARHGMVALLQGTLASLVFSAAFALSVAPLSLAALGARSRAGGYFALVLVLVLPELFEGTLARLLPEGWGELIAVPSALAALASGLSPGTVDAPRVLRALVVLTFVVAGSLAVVRSQLSRARELAQS